jgi:hypothetical protein
MCFVKYSIKGLSYDYRRKLEESESKQILLDEQISYNDELKSELEKARKLHE